MDICQQIPSVAYPMSTPEELDQTVKEVEALDRRIVATQADVRDRDAPQAAFDDGLAQLGGVDIVLAKTGVASMGVEVKPNEWDDVIGVNLTGVFNTVEASKQALIDRGGGAIVLTSSTAGPNGIGGNQPGGLGYTASKHGVVGLMRSYANSLAEHSIRVNTVHPTGVNTPMVVNDVMQEFLQQDPSLSPGDGQRAAGGDAGSGGHLQRNTLAGLRRGPLRHRGRPGLYQHPCQHITHTGHAEPHGSTSSHATHPATRGKLVHLMEALPRRQAPALYSRDADPGVRR